MKAGTEIIRTCTEFKRRCRKFEDKWPNTLQSIGLFQKLDGHSLVMVALRYRRMGQGLLKHMFAVFID